MPHSRAVRRALSPVTRVVRACMPNWCNESGIKNPLFIAMPQASETLSSPTKRTALS